jgi:hypothetical protein
VASSQRRNDQVAMSVAGLGPDISVLCMFDVLTGNGHANT